MARLQLAWTLGAVQNQNGPGLVWESVKVIPEESEVAYQGAADPADEFDSFVDAFSPRLLRAAVLLTGDHGRAEDLVQDALARAFLRWDCIVNEDPMAYVRRSMLNGYVDWWRRRPWREQPVAVLPEHSGPSIDATDSHATTDALLRALDGLTRRERAVVVLRYFDDLSESQIAEALSIAPGTVKSACSRALAKLRTSAHLAGDRSETLSIPGRDLP